MKFFGIKVKLRVRMRFSIKAELEIRAKPKIKSKFILLANLLLKLVNLDYTDLNKPESIAKVFKKVFF